MADRERGTVDWYTVDPRPILPLDSFHVPRRLARFLSKAPFRYTRDRAFESVVRACADRPDSWISEGIVRSYTRLQRLGHAHSVEVWLGEELAGGLYGVHLGGAFFGESVFHRESNAAKAALVHLAGHLRARGFLLLEIQMVTPFTAPFQPRMVGKVEYGRLLRQALRVRRAWEPEQGGGS